MKRVWVVAFAMLLAGGLLAPAFAQGKKGMESVEKAKLPCKIFSNCGEDKGALFAPSGWMGDTEALEFDDCCKENAHGGDSCIKVTFNPSKQWGAIAWQNPPNNWGDDEGGVDLTGARQLSLWARGEKGGEKVEFKMGIVGRSKPYFDTGKAGLENVRLTKEWKQYVISLSGKNLSRIITGFVVSAEGKKDPVVFYLDDIVYE